MFTEVYWHHAVRSATTMFARAFLDLLPKLDLTALFRMEEPDLIRTLRMAAAGSETAMLTEGLFGSRRRLHKRLAEYSIFHNEDLYRQLRQKTFTQVAGCAELLCRELQQKLGRPIGRLDVLIDAPPLHREVEFRVDVRISGDRRFRPLREISPIVDSMARTQFDDCVKKVRLFATEELRETLRSTLPAGWVEDLLREVLQSVD
jgi:HD superfamily phosphohydrolase